jgi:putative proteasome-type protease
MTYCVGVLLNGGVVLASDSRTHAGVDNFASFCKMTVFERPGDRVIVLLSSGNLAGTQSVISTLKQRGDLPASGAPTIWNARTMFDIAGIVADAVKDVERRDTTAPATAPNPFNASFIIGGQIRGEAPRLFRTFAEGNFIEAGPDTIFFQTGETKYGKPIIDRVITPSTSLGDAMKCILLSFDSTMRSNLSVAMPIDLAAIERDALQVGLRHRFEPDDEYFRKLQHEWRDGVRDLFRRLSPVPSNLPEPWSSPVPGRRS